jgi:hypothetical protein
MTYTGTVQPVSGTTIAAQYSHTTTDQFFKKITLLFQGAAPVFGFHITATAFPGGATLGSLSCTASCGDDCTAPTLPASGQTSLEFSTGTTYTFTCRAAHGSDSGTTTKTFSLVVAGECAQ